MWSGAEALWVSYPLLDGGSPLNLEMLDIAEKDLVAPASAFPTPEPKDEEQITLQVSREPCASSQRKLPIWQEDWTLYGEDFHQYHWGLCADMQTDPIKVWQGVYP